MVAKILGLEPDRKILHALFGVNDLLRPVLGESAYKLRVAKILDTEKPGLAIVEAVRTKEEYEEFVVKRGGILIGVMARPEIRFRRAVADAQKRLGKQDEGRTTFREFIGDTKKKTGEHSPVEKEISWILKKAHFVIENNFNNTGPFYKQIDRTAKRMDL